MKNKTITCNFKSIENPIQSHQTETETLSRRNIPCRIVERSKYSSLTYVTSVQEGDSIPIRIWPRTQSFTIIILENNSQPDEFSQTDENVMPVAWKMSDEGKKKRSRKRHFRRFKQTKPIPAVIDNRELHTINFETKWPHD